MRTMVEKQMNSKRLVTHTYTCFHLTRAGRSTILEAQHEALHASVCTDCPLGIKAACAATGPVDLFAETFFCFVSIKEGLGNVQVALCNAAKTSPSGR